MKKDAAKISTSTFMGHPTGLAILFFTEAWERFSYYGMRSLLILYLTQHFLFSDQRSATMYGAYTALVFALSIVGGVLSDRYLGQRKAIVFGSILLIIGHFGMTFEGSGSKNIFTYDAKTYELTYDNRGAGATLLVTSDNGVSAARFNASGDQLIIAEPESVRLPQQIALGKEDIRIERQTIFVWCLYLSLSFIIAGVGFLKPNITSMVGALYDHDDPRRESAFTLFYMGVNMGAFLSTLTCGVLGVKYGWKYGFGLAGIGMVLGVCVFLWGEKYLRGIGDPRDPECLGKKVFGPISLENFCYATGLFIVFGSALIIMNAHLINEYFIISLALMVVFFLIYYAVNKESGKSRNKMLAAIYFTVAQIPLWAMLEQSGSSLNLFTDRLVDRSLFSWSLPTPLFLSLNPLFIFLFAPIFASLWSYLGARNRDPSGPVKYALGIMGSGLAFLPLTFAIAHDASSSALIPVYSVVLVYLIITIAELFIGPVGLSMVTRLSPPRIIGLTVGAWFLFLGFSNFAGGVIAGLAGVETVAGQVTDVVAAKERYLNVYRTLSMIGLGSGAVMLALSPLIKFLMKD
ncbi:MAG: peptide MFS transporter [Pseudomonadota bacterium]